MKIEIEYPKELLLEIIYLNGTLVGVGTKMPELININKLSNQLLKILEIKNEA